MAAIIAQITRANRERKRKKTYEIQKCMYDLPPFDPHFDPLIHNKYLARSVGWGKVGILTKLIKWFNNNNGLIIMIKVGTDCFWPPQKSLSFWPAGESSGNSGRKRRSCWRRRCSVNRRSSRRGPRQRPASAALGPAWWRRPSSVSWTETVMSNESSVLVSYLLCLPFTA